MVTISPDLAADLRAEPKLWAVTGAAGFIGSHLVEALLRLGQRVVGLDNFSTGHRRNLPDAPGFHLIEGDIRDPATCADAVAGAEVVLHHAALGSVPWSMDDPRRTHEVNTTGFLNMLMAAREASCRRVVYAASSASYGSLDAVPAVEESIGDPLSPYAASKTANEAYAGAFAEGFGLSSVGLRYFNVFGARQDPEGPYAAVIPRWIATLLGGERVVINGDGETTRDFCHVANVVTANLLAATVELPAPHRVYNIACGEEISLNRLLTEIRKGLSELGLETPAEPVHGPFREGDVRRSRAGIGRGVAELGYRPEVGLAEGLARAMPWYCAEAGVDLQGAGLSD
ncbi:MAG: SDR family oxidoreductase [Pseudomonadota bacterium]